MKNYAANFHPKTKQTFIKTVLAINNLGICRYVLIILSLMSLKGYLIETKHRIHHVLLQQAPLQL